MTRPVVTGSTHPNARDTSDRIVGIVLLSKRMLTSAEIAETLDLRPDTVQRYLSAARKAGTIVLVARTLWASADVGNAARAEIHAAAKERRRLVRLEIAAAKRRQSGQWLKYQFRASNGKPVQIRRAAQAGDAVVSGPNSVFALGAAVQA